MGELVYALAICEPLDPCYHVSLLVLALAGHRVGPANLRNGHAVVLPVVDGCDTLCQRWGRSEVLGEDHLCFLPWCTEQDEDHDERGESHPGKVKAGNHRDRCMCVSYAGAGQV